MSATTHPVAPEEVMAFLDGELTLKHAQSVSIHVEECVECQKVRDSFLSTSQTLSGWSVPALPKGIEEQVSKDAADIRSLPPNQFISDLRGFFSRRSTWALGGLAFVLLVLFVGFNSSRRMASFDMAAQREYTYDLPEKTVQLDDHARGAGKGSLGKLQKELPASPMARPTFTGTDTNLRVQEHGRNQAPQGSVEPMIARTASLSVVAKDFDAGRASVDGILARHNGYAASLNVGTPQGAARTLQASLRIPAPQLAGAISELKSLGRVENETQSGEEVTQQHADLVARLKNSRETEQRLQDVLRTRTGKVKDVLEVEEEIARVRGEIEQMEAEQKTLEHRVEFATIDLKLSEEYKAQLNPPAPSVWMQLRNASVNGFRNAFDNLLGIVLFFAESGPTIVLWLAILGIPGWLLWWRYRRVHAVGSLSGA